MHGRSEEKGRRENEEGMREKIPGRKIQTGEGGEGRDRRGGPWKSNEFRIRRRVGTQRMGQVG